MIKELLIVIIIIKLINEANFTISEISQLHIKYNLIKEYYNKKKEDILFYRIKLLTDFLNIENYEKYENLIKDNFIKADKIISNLELIYKDYIYFYPHDKKLMNTIFEKEINELKSSDLTLILNSKHKYKKYLKYKESSNLRKTYLKSKIFNLIYSNKKNLFKNQDLKIIQETEDQFNIIKNIIENETVKNIKAKDLEIFKELNNIGELEKEIDIILEIFELKNKNKEKIIKELSLLLFEKYDIINAVHNLLFLIEFTNSQKKELYNLLKNAILKNIQNSVSINVIKSSEQILKIYGFVNKNYIYLNILKQINEEKNNQNLKPNQFSKKINIFNNFFIFN